MKKTAIPSVPLDDKNREVLEALKENIEILTGQRGTKLTLLSANATLLQVISRVNAIINVLQNPQ